MSEEQPQYARAAEPDGEVWFIHGDADVVSIPIPNEFSGVSIMQCVQSEGIFVKWEQEQQPEDPKLN